MAIQGGSWAFGRFFVPLGAMLVACGLVACGQTSGGEGGPEPTAALGESGGGGGGAEEAVLDFGDGGRPEANGPVQTGGSGSLGASGLTQEPVDGVAIRFDGKPGSGASGTAESIGIYGYADVDGNVSWANMSSAEHELCVEAELASTEDHVELHFGLSSNGIGGVGYYDATAHGVTGFAFDLEVEPAALTTRFSVLASFADRGASFRGKLAPSHNVFRFSELASEIEPAPSAIHHSDIRCCW
jgi:hypothetical protein